MKTRTQAWSLQLYAYDYGSQGYLNIFFILNLRFSANTAIKGKRKMRYEGNITKSTAVLTHASLVLKRVSNIKELDVSAWKFQKSHSTFNGTRNNSSLELRLMHPPW
jgi:hypothetical protein